VRVEDAAGNRGSASSAFTTTIDSQLPTATANITAVADNVGTIQGNLSSGGVTDDTSLVLSGAITGSLASGEVVAVYDGAAKLGTANVSGSAWTYNAPTLVNGNTVNYTVRVEDAAGNQGAASSVFATTVDTVAPTKVATLTTVSDNFGIIQGNLSSGGATDDTTLTLSGTVSATLLSNELVAVYDGATRLGYALPIGATTWSFVTAALADGHVANFTVRVEDTAGNQAGASAVFTATIDTTAPSTNATITQVLDNYGISHILANGDTTDDTSLDLSGTLTASLAVGEVLGVYDGGVRLAGNAVVSGTNWTYTDTTLVNGDTPSYTVRVEDAVGNQGTAGSAFGVTISQPTNVAVITTVLTDTGFNPTVANNGSTKDLTPVLNGTYSGTLGTNVLAVFDGSNYLGNATVNTTNSTWSFADTATDGSTRVYNVVARTAAGDQGTPSASYTVIVSTVVPATPVIVAATDDVGTVQGLVASGGTTDDSALLLTGTNVAGTTVQVFNGATLLGGTVTAIDATHWSYTANVANGTTYQFNAKATNGSGTSGASTSYTITGDTLANPLNAPTLSAASDSGTSNSDRLTKITTPTFTGSGAEAGAAITLKEGSTVLGTTTADGSGNWSIVSSTLAGGVHAISASQVDVAGNASIVTSTQSVTIDTTAPGTSSANFTNSGGNGVISQPTELGHFPLAQPHDRQQPGLGWQRRCQHADRIQQFFTERRQRHTCDLHHPSAARHRRGAHPLRLHLGPVRRRRRQCHGLGGRVCGRLRREYHRPEQLDLWRAAKAARQWWQRHPERLFRQRCAGGRRWCRRTDGWIWCRHHPTGGRRRQHLIRQGRDQHQHG
jgi:Bacterial Ig-like domain